MEKPDLLQGTLDMLVLKVLSREATHGFGICQRIQQLSDDVLSVGEGSLYPALYSLQDQGWIEMRTQENIHAGMNPEEARYAALRQFGWLESIKEKCRDQRGVGWIENLVQDIRYGARMMRKNPVSTVMAVLILALGIGGNTAVWSVLDPTILHPFPAKESERLVASQEVDTL